MIPRLRIFAILALCVVTTLMAVPYEQTEEYRQKQAILNERAARFKAETGFEGDIGYNYQSKNLSSYRGNFRDIDVSAPQDTVAMGLVLVQVFEKMKPYLLAREGQLFEGSQEWKSKMWVQKINGYSVYPGGYLSIRYNDETNDFIINDATVDIPNTLIPIKVSKEYAMQIMIDEYKKSDFYKGQVRSVSREPSLEYLRLSKSQHPSEYRLYWSMMFFDISFSVDVQTLEVHRQLNVKTK